MTRDLTTETGIGYFEDPDGRVVDYYDLPSGAHMMGTPRVSAVDVDDTSDLPPIDNHYQEQ